MLTKIALKEYIANYVNELLTEAEPGKVKFSARAEEEETAAKQKYEQAKEKLEYWESENAKKTAFLKVLADAGIKDASSKRAKEIQLKDPASYSYDKSILMQKEATLKRDLEKLKQAYGEFKPAIVGYKRKEVTQSRPEPEIPGDDKKAYVDINEIKPLAWYRWADPRWGKVATKIKYGSVSEKSEEATTGTGPGEDRLAAILGGQVQGGSVSYDVVLKDGSKWEVKALDKQSDLIRPGTEGLAAFDKPRKKLERLMAQLRNFSVVVRRFKLNDPTVGGEDADVLNYILNFVDGEAGDMIAKGEISAGRFREFRTMMKELFELKRKWGFNPDEKVKPDTRVGLAGKEIEVDKGTYIDVAKTVEKSRPDVNVLKNFSEKELAIAAINSAAFDNYSEFLDDWFDSVKASKVFSHVDGVFIVNQLGFSKVPRSMFKQAFPFAKVSQGKPRFSYAFYT